MCFPPHGGTMVAWPLSFGHIHMSERFQDIQESQTSDFCEFSLQTGSLMRVWMHVQILGLS